MSDNSSLPTRRSLLAASAAAGAVGLLPSHLAVAATEADAIPPFGVHVSDEALADLRRRLAATRWPDKETVSGHSHGAQLAATEELVGSLGTECDCCAVVLA